MAGLSVMAFDSGVTQEAWNFVIIVWSYSIWPVGFAIASWIAYARKKDKLAGVLTTLIFIPILILIGVIYVGNLIKTLVGNWSHYETSFLFRFQNMSQDRRT